MSPLRRQNRVSVQGFGLIPSILGLAGIRSQTFCQTLVGLMFEYITGTGALHFASHINYTDIYLIRACQAEILHSLSILPKRMSSEVNDTHIVSNFQCLINTEWLREEKL